MRVLFVSSLGIENGGGGEWDALRKAEELVVNGASVGWASVVRTGSYGHVAAYVERSVGIALFSISPECVETSVADILAAFRPTLVYTYGDLSNVAARAAEAARVPVLVGIHFWTAVVQLSDVTRNQQVLQYASSHRSQPWADELLDRADGVFACSSYVSYALQDILHRTICRVIPSLPHRFSISRAAYSPYRRFVLFGSVHPHKGGPVALALAKRHPGIPLLCLHPESGSEQMVASIRATNATRSVFRASIVPMSDAYASARVVVCGGVVDETFGRVALESAYNGVPLVTSMRGNLAALAYAGSTAIDPTDPDAAADVVAELYRSSPSALMARSQEAIRFAERLESSECHAFFDTCTEIAAKKKTVAVIVPWADTGLGKQGKVYVDALERMSVATSVFSYCTYDRESSAWWKRRDQRDPSEWIHPRIYYSRNTREKVLPEELRSFVRSFYVDVAIIPELCGGAIQIIQTLRECDVRVISVPNIEFVRAGDVPLVEAHIDAIAANNYQSFAYFASRPTTTHKTHYLCFPVQPDRIARHAAQRAKSTRSVLPFSHDCVTVLLCCGRVGKKRKRAHTCTEAFAKHVGAHPDTKVRFILTSQSAELLGPIVPVDAKYMHVHTENMSNDELVALRSSCDITVMVSNEEGLGMEFFEAMEAAAILLTHDGHPHRMFATHMVTGFVAHADVVPTAEDINPDPVVESNRVSVESLCDIFQCINQMSREELEQMRVKAIEFYKTSFSSSAFEKRLFSILQMCRAP